MAKHQVVLLPGDGIGPEVADAARRVVDASGPDIEWMPMEIGVGAFEKYGDALPEAVLTEIRRCGVALKGPTTTPSGRGHVSANVRLRRELGLFANVRPVKSVPGLDTPYGKTDLVIVRENTESLYAGFENEVAPGVVKAKDIYQEAVIAFYERVQQPAFTLTCKIKTYLYAVSRRLWLKKLAEKKRFNGSIDEVETFLGIEEEIKEVSERESRFKKMGIALEGLGEPCKSIIEDFYIADLSMEEISVKFNYTNADNAKNQKYKCLQRLKKLFFENYKEASNG
jgi:RNA polymerase sigma factor (sigma-70 family)